MVAALSDVHYNSNALRALRDGPTEEEESHGKNEHVISGGETTE